MGLINYKALIALSTHTKQCTAVDKSLRLQEIQDQNFFLNIRNLKISWERLESNPGRLGAKRERYLCAMPTPHFDLDLPISLNRNTYL